MHGLRITLAGLIAWLACAGSDGSSAGMSGSGGAAAGGTVGAGGTAGAAPDAGAADGPVTPPSDGPPPAPLPDAAPPVPIGERIAAVTVAGPAGAFVTFGQPFRPGDVPAGHTLVARTSAGAALALQVDAKATHPDGSLRHALITAQVPSAGELALYAADPVAALPAVAAADLLATPFDVKVSLTLAGTAYTASARPLLMAGAPTWIAGPLCTEWTLAAPLTANGAVHPHLSARFDVRAYAGLGTVLVSVTIENDWAYEPRPQSFTYDAVIATDRGEVLRAPGLQHYTQARWRHVFVWGQDLIGQATHELRYLIATGAVPRFDPLVKAAPAALAALEGAFAGPKAAPLGVGLAAPYMPETGGRGDIGPLPSWTSLYLISGDARARRATLGTADRAGSWSIHYRDKATGRPVSLDDHPRMTLLGNPPDTCDPNTKVCDSFPACGGDCRSPYTPDSPHQPSLAYVPYLLTGDRYYLDELHFWANWNMLQANPAYRGYAQGLLKWDQARGQAWSLRTLGQAAYVTPDADPLKRYFVDRLKNNLAWYDQQYSHNAQANPFGFIDTGATVGEDGTIAPWMDDFFTWSTGHLVALGFEEARALRDWKVQYAISRMMNPAYCWIFASVYHMAVQDPASKRRYTTWAEIYGPTLADAKASAAANLACGSPEMAAALGLKAGEMVGYSAGPEGYPSNLQPALAIAADSVPGGREAWDRFLGRAVKPDYSSEPQFAIVPADPQ